MAIVIAADTALVLKGLVSKGGRWVIGVARIIIIVYYMLISIRLFYTRYSDFIRKPVDV